MINIKTNREIELMRVAGKIVGETHKFLEPYIKPGITTKKLDSLAHEFILSKGATPSFLNLYGFPGSVCISVNEEVVHGIPSNRVLQDGDIVKIDIGACYKGYHGDSAWTYPVGNIDEETKFLLKHTEASLMGAIKIIKAGIRVGDISHTIESYAKSKDLGVVRELVGHGIGSNVHEEPDVPNFGKPGKGPILKEGMVIAVEPMLNLGNRDIFILDDGWTIVTADNKPSAHFEHTILVLKDGCEILTKR
jgi:methionyl aminopeptidase